MPNDRCLRLQGCWNIRDLGGLRGADGRSVTRGLVFRAAAPGLATDDDLALLAGLGLRQVFDLRADRERGAADRLWCEGFGIQPWTRDYTGRAGDLRARLSDPGSADVNMQVAMQAAYRRLPYEQAPAIAAIFAALARGETPLLFHCAVGKDRTGMIAALLLAVLGVSRDDILADYLLTNDHEVAIRASLRNHPDLAAIDSGDELVLTPLAVAHPDYLAALFDAVDAEAGSTAAFLEQVAGVTRDALARIRGHLLA